MKLFLFQQMIYQAAVTGVASAEAFLDQFRREMKADNSLRQGISRGIYFLVKHFPIANPMKNSG